MKNVQQNNEDKEVFIMSNRTKIRLNFILVFIFTVGYVYCNVRYPLIIQSIIDGLSNPSAAGVKTLFISLFIISAVLILCSRYQTLFKTKYLNAVRHTYRKKVMSGIFAQEDQGISSQKEAEILSVFNNDIPMICSDYYETILSIIYSFVVILFSLSALVTINRWMMILILLNFVLLAIVPLLFKKILQKKKQEISDSLKRLNVCIKDNIFCLPIIKSCLAERQMEEKLEASSQKNNDASYSHAKTQENANLLSMIIGYGNDFFVKQF